MLRARCERQAKSFATPMGDEMFYRYQQSLIDDTTAVLKTLLQAFVSVASCVSARPGMQAFCFEIACSLKRPIKRRAH
jgi:hypothetical protein